MTADARTEPREGSFVRVGDIDVYYREAGSGEPLVLVNQGMASGSAAWEGDPTAYASFIDLFARRFRVIVPDPRGSGRTSHTGGDHLRPARRRSRRPDRRARLERQLGRST